MPVGSTSSGLVDSAVLERARGLFEESELTHGLALNLSLNLMGAGILVKQSTNTDGETENDTSHLMAVLRATRVLTSRLSDLFTQLDQIYWLQSLRLEQDEPDSSRLSVYIELAIRSFHVLLASLMDNVPLLALQLDVPLSTKEWDRPPSFVAIIADSRGKRGCDVPTEIGHVVDSTQRWWRPVKRIRDALVHREHYLISFGDAADGILFQIYDATVEPKLSDPDLLWPTGHNVLDFRMYSAFVMSELLVFLQDLGDSANDYLEVGANRPGMIVGGGAHDELVGSIDELLERTRHGGSAPN